MKLKSNNQLLSIVFFTVLFISYQNCSNPGAGISIRDINTSLSSTNLDDPENPGVVDAPPLMLTPTPSPTPSASQTQNPSTETNGTSTPNPTPIYLYKETNQQVQGALQSDILIVIDNSGSMRFEQSSIASRFGSFIEQLSGLNWRLGIVTTDVQYISKEYSDGRLLTFGSSGRYYLDSSQSLTEANSLFSSTIQRNETGSGYERGIMAAYRALEREEDPATSKSFLRKGVPLAVIVVSDANETALLKSSIVNDVNLINYRDYPENLKSFVSSLGKSFTFNSIVVKDGDLACKQSNPTTCYNANTGQMNVCYDNEDYGSTYSYLSRITNGVIGSVCEVDYSNQLSQVGRGVVNQVNTIELGCVPADRNSDGIIDLEVEYNASKIEKSNYTLIGSRVQFNQALKEGQYKVKYYCQQ